MNDTMDREPYEDPTPSEGTSLLELSGVLKAMRDIQQEKQDELERVHQQVDDSYRVILAKCQSVYWEKLAQVYDDGFSDEDVEQLLDSLLQN